VRADFHYASGRAGIAQLGEKSLHFVGLRRGVGRFYFRTRSAIDDGAE
jgi:hypothetical protein